MLGRSVRNFANGSRVPTAAGILVAWWLGAAAALAAAPSSMTSSLSDCEDLQVTGERAQCRENVCTVTGDVLLLCNEARLSADTLVLVFANERLVRVDAPAGLRFVEGTNVVEGSTAQLQQSREGTLHSFVIQQKAKDAPPGDDRLRTPLGRDELVLCGRTLVRSPRGDVALKDGTITLCDCGLNRRPSWRLRAPSVRIRAGATRATIFWPRLEANVFGLGLVPVSPPFLPLSVPLVPRAFGLLPPELQFLGPPYPTIDLPVFVPLGESYDLTLTPGVRADWAGAPRLGVRLRARPTERLQFRVQVHDTWDMKHAMAARRRAFDLSLVPALAGDPLWQNIDRQRRHLVHRISAEAHLRWHRQASAWHRDPNHVRVHSDVQIDAAALSDDGVYRDLSILPLERSMAYLPSRALWTVRAPQGVLSVSADAMQNLSSVQRIDGRIVPIFDNLRGQERGTLHRGPAVRLVALRQAPWARLPSVTLAGEAAIARYGPVPGVAGHTPSEKARQLDLGARQIVAGAVLELGVAKRLGPVRLRASGRADALLIDQQRQALLATVTPIAELESGLMFARRYKGVWHDISPFVALRHLQQSRRTTARLATRAALGLDERAERRRLTQVVLGVRQSLWRGSARQAYPLLRFEALVPVDVSLGTLLQPWLRLTIDEPVVGQWVVQSSLDVHRLAERPVNQAWRELDVSYARALGPLVGTIGYVRLAPDSDRLLRSLYDLAGPREAVDVFAPWVHTLRVGSFLSWRQRVHGSATVLLQLPQPQPVQMANTVVPRPPRNLRRINIASVSASLGYASPCRCWSADFVLGANPTDFVRTFRFVVLLNVAGFRLGAPLRAD